MNKKLLLDPTLCTWVHTQLFESKATTFSICFSDDMVLPALANKAGSEERVMSPSDSALDNGQLFPCNVCGRTFLQKALERHVKVCQKVSTKKRNVFDLAKKRTEGMEPVPASKEPPKRKIVKPEDEFQQCPSCHRKFGDKVRHNSLM